LEFQTSECNKKWRITVFAWWSGGHLKNVSPQPKPNKDAGVDEKNQSRTSLAKSFGGMPLLFDVQEKPPITFSSHYRQNFFSYGCLAANFKIK